MATMNISLPDKLKKWVEKRVKSGDYSNSSDFMRDILRREKTRAEYIAWLNEEIDKGITSGFSEMTTEDAFAAAKSRALVRIEKSAA